MEARGKWLVQRRLASPAELGPRPSPTPRQQPSLALSSPCDCTVLRAWQAIPRFTEAPSRRYLCYSCCAERTLHSGRLSSLSSNLVSRKSGFQQLRPEATLLSANPTASPLRKFSFPIRPTDLLTELTELCEHQRQPQSAWYRGGFQRTCVALPEPHGFPDPGWDPRTEMERQTRDGD